MRRLVNQQSNKKFIQPINAGWYGSEFSSSMPPEMAFSVNEADWRCFIAELNEFNARKERTVKYIMGFIVIVFIFLQGMSAAQTKINWSAIMDGTDRDQNRVEEQTRVRAMGQTKRDIWN